jgi:ATP-binding protein involved in chromosome partitioning
MFENVHVPILGIVENMAYFTPPDLPDRKYYLFGEGGAKRLAETRGLPFLGQIPIDQDVREGGDMGTPVVVREPDGIAAQAFQHVARATVASVDIRVAEQPPTLATEILYR